MSIAGIRSNRGDDYQTLVAFDWALTVLSDPDFEWIEVDSVSYSVDDVVIGKTDGTEICCQCKKNQQNFRTWTIANLADELEKAFSLLASNMNAKVCFYSRCPFSALAKLREYAVSFPDEASYRTNMSNEHQKIDAELSAKIALQSHNLSTYEFLCRTTFEISADYHRMESQLHERLRSIASNTEAAYNALWTRIDKLGGRMEGASGSSSPQHRLTKEDLKTILQQAGAMLAPSMDLAEVRTSFNNTSAIGRTWNRVIAGERIGIPVLTKLLEAVDAKNRSILLTGLPGSGKTCAMLALQEALEDRAQNCTDIVPLFIQSREFADLATAQDRQAQGLPEQWVEKASRMAEQAHVVIVIDSLDVLSIAREHSVLSYFLAQVDRLLLIPNITIVTACRDFDRHYDRRISERQWDCELNCAPLNWDAEIVPLLNKIGIDTTTIDMVTRELIRNPRELALFVELAQREGSFSVVTSQALAQRYIDTIVRADNLLGETAMQAIEAVANEMLKSRSLAIPHQRFSASQDIQKILCSLNVLQETQEGKLIFGHQTLLDVLVISRATRQGISLNQFIQALPPVPFVRPSIRSFVAQLAMGKRSEFRKQLRTVFIGRAAFHVRRLVAESFAEQIPQDDDWPLIRDLHNKHREIFHVIYTHGVQIDWHHFWLKHLVPILIDSRDIEGLTAHVHRLSQWKNEDATGVLQFWTKVLSLDWLNGNGITDRLGHYLSEINPENLTIVRPLLERLLSIPRQDDDLLGHAIAHCVEAGAVGDTWLWSYIAGDISDEDVLKYKLNNKLRCQTHEFGISNKNFLRNRMEQSTTLLDLAIESIEEWSRIKSTRYSNNSAAYRSEFLPETSHKNAYSQAGDRHKSSEGILLDAVESAILNHAKTHSDWWQSNRERLSFSLEGALRYFATLACTASPEANIDLIGRILCKKELLESDLSYELGALTHVAFIRIDLKIQDAMMATLLTLWEESMTEEKELIGILHNRALLIVTIPCHLRSPETQSMLENYEQTEGTLIRQQPTGRLGGLVSAPFSYDVFLEASDDSVIRLLKHYTGYGKNLDDLLIGGEQEVGWQLREASSRQPTRFLSLLHTNWADVSEGFSNNIMDGVANYLLYCYGNRQTNGTWTPLDKPDAQALASHILDELERHSRHWRLNDSASNALQACANVIDSAQNSTRLVFLIIGFVNLREKNSIIGDSNDLISSGINMTKGHVAEALMILANKLQERSIPFPDLLSPTLRSFARDENPAIRALIIQRLPYLQNSNPDLGWDLFHIAMQDATGLWVTAEPCLYYAYHNHFEKVAPLLARIHREGISNDMETWGRISALAALSNRIDFAVLLENLKVLDATEAWLGAASVWTNHENIKQHHEKCITGMDAGLNSNSHHAAAIAQQMGSLFRENTPVISIPIEMFRLLFYVFERDNENKHHRLFGFNEWLNVTSHRDPEHALAATEIYLAYVKRTKHYLYDHANNLTQLMTRLFAEAEEREESDDGEMLQRVVSIQDTLLSLGVDSINVWLKAAERP